MIISGSEVFPLAIFEKDCVYKVSYFGEKGLL
jgi:hypothetical protein